MQSVSEESVLVLTNVSTIPVARIGRNATSGAKSALFFTLFISLVSHLIPPIATTTAMYLKLSEGVSKI